MKFKSILLAISALILSTNYAEASPRDPFPTISDVKCGSDALCSTLTDVKVLTVTYQGFSGTATYAWDGTTACPSPDGIFTFKPSGATHCFALKGFASRAAGTYYFPTASIAALRAYGINSSVISRASVDAYYLNGVYGGGNFIWTIPANAPGGACTPDEGTVIAATGVSTSVGCWVRQYSGTIYASWFGWLSASSVSTSTTALQNFVNAVAVSSSGRVGVIDCGVGHINAHIVVPFSQGWDIGGSGLCTQIIQDANNTPFWHFTNDTTWGWRLHDMTLTWNTPQTHAADPQSNVIYLDATVPLFGFWSFAVYGINADYGNRFFSTNAANSNFFWQGEISQNTHRGHMAGAFFNNQQLVSGGQPTLNIHDNYIYADTIAAGETIIYCNACNNLRISENEINEVVNNNTMIDIEGGSLVGGTFKFGEQTTYTTDASLFICNNTSMDIQRVDFDINTINAAGHKIKGFNVGSACTVNVGTVITPPAPVAGTFYVATSSGSLIINQIQGLVGTANEWLTDIPSSGSADNVRVLNWELPHLSANQGDASVTWTPGSSARILRFDTTLTANRTVTIANGISADSNIYGGYGPVVVRTGLGAFTLTLKDSTGTTIGVIPANQPGVVAGCYFRFGFERCDAAQGLLSLNGGTITGPLTTQSNDVTTAKLCTNNTGTGGKISCLVSGFTGATQAGLSLLYDGVTVVWIQSNTQVRWPGYTTAGTLVVDASGNMTSDTAIKDTLTGTTGSIGGGALLAGACTSGTVGITGATTAMGIVATPVTYPGDGIFWHGYVSSSNTITVKVCAAIAATPTASTYNVRVVQ